MKFLFQYNTAARNIILGTICNKLVRRQICNHQMESSSLLALPDVLLFLAGSAPLRSTTMLHQAAFPLHLTTRPHHSSSAPPHFTTRPNQKALSLYPITWPYWAAFSLYLTTRPHQATPPTFPPLPLYHQAYQAALSLYPTANSHWAALSLYPTTRLYWAAFSFYFIIRPHRATPPSLLPLYYQASLGSALSLSYNQASSSSTLSALLPGLIRQRSSSIL